MALTDQRHTVRLPLPDLLVRGSANVVKAPVYLNGSLVAPASGTVTLYDPGGTAVVSGASATITASVATYSIGSGVLTSYAFGEGWVVSWTLTLDDGTVLTPRNDAAVVRSGLWPVVTDADLFRRVPSLDPNGAGNLTETTTYQDALDEAWTELNLRIIAKGNRPNLILEPSALRACHLYLALALVHEGEETRMAAAYGDRAAHFRALYEQAWTELNPRYSSGDDVVADARRRSQTPTIWLCGGSGRTLKTW